MSANNAIILLEFRNYMHIFQKYLLPFIFHMLVNCWAKKKTLLCYYTENNLFSYVINKNAFLKWWRLLSFAYILVKREKILMQIE